MGLGVAGLAVLGLSIFFLLFLNQFMGIEVFDKNMLDGS